MPVPITPVFLPAITSPVALPNAQLGQPSVFADLVASAMAGVERHAQAAKTATSDLLIEGKGEIHEVALMAQRAELTLELFQQVRNKLVQAYQEVMRMPM